MKNPFHKVPLTVGQFIDNIEKNGLAHIRFRYFEYDNDYSNKNFSDKPIAACALGQGIWNSFHDTDIPYAFSSAVNRTAPDLWVNIQCWNDTDKLSIQEIVNKARKQYRGYLDNPIRHGDQGYFAH